MNFSVLNFSYNRENRALFRPKWLKVLFLFLFFAFNFIHLSLFAKSYTIEKIDIQAQILRNGNLQINETRTYQFNGEYTWADYRLPLDQLGKVSEFSVIDGEDEYRKSQSKKPGTYQIEQDGEEFYVRWFYRADDEQKSFTLNYNVGKAGGASGGAG